ASVFLICAIWSLVALPGRVAQSTISGWAGGPVYDFGVPHPSRFCSGGVVPGSSLAAAFPSAPAAVPSTPIQSPPCPPPPSSSAGCPGSRAVRDPGLRSRVTGIVCSPIEATTFSHPSVAPTRVSKTTRPGAPVQPARCDLDHLRTRAQALRLALQLFQDQAADQLGLRLAPLRRQRFELAQLALVQLRAHMMQPVLRPPHPLCHQPRLIQQCHRSHPRTGSVSKRKHRFPYGTPELTIYWMQRCFRATNARFP